jgi:hypothetical protein
LGHEKDDDEDDLNELDEEMIADELEDEKCEPFEAIFDDCLPLLLQFRSQAKKF